MGNSHPLARHLASFSSLALTTTLVVASPFQMSAFQSLGLSSKMGIASLSTLRRELAQDHAHAVDQLG